MLARIITIGDEILIGQITDTNSAWIARRLNEEGIRVCGKCSVGDDASGILRAVDEAINDCDLVIVTGGIGPTKDDITKNTLAEYFNCTLVRHQPSYDHIRTMLAARGVDFNELNQSQAMVPECCEVLMNDNGTAPGMWFERDGVVLVSLPGVPFEMEVLINDKVLPKIHQIRDLPQIIHRTVLTFGLPESVLAQTIADWEDSLPVDLRLAYLPNPTGIKLRLSCYDGIGSDSVGEIERQFMALEAIIPEYIVGYGDDSVEGAVARLLIERGQTLSVAESCTGGAICSRFTSMAGASGYMLGGVVAYSNDVKCAVLGVNYRDLEKYGAVSRQVAEQMAVGMRKLTGSTFAIATTGIAGPDGGSEEKPVGTVWIAVASPEGVISQKSFFGRLRRQNIDRASTAAINKLRNCLIL